MREEPIHAGGTLLLSCFESAILLGERLCSNSPIGGIARACNPRTATSAFLSDDNDEEKRDPRSRQLKHAATDTIST